MKKLLLVLSSIALLLSVPAHAAQRVFVASYGDNTNPGTVELPFRHPQKGVGTVAAGGEVVILDSGSYNSFTVTKSVSVIAAPGVYAGITVTSGDGITVTITASDTVVLRG